MINVGDKVFIRGYEGLPFTIININKTDKSVALIHPFTGCIMNFKENEIVKQLRVNGEK